MAVSEERGRIYVAGHQGLAGSAIVRRLLQGGATDVVTRTRAQLDLIDQGAVARFFATERIQQLYIAAAKVGGIFANMTYPAEFIHSNLAIQTNLIHAAWQHGVEKLCFLGSSCIYPANASQPMLEDCLLSGVLEPTNEFYAVAKIAGIKMCQAYRKQYGFDAIGIIPTNLYGPGDNFHADNSHVIPGMMRRFHEAKIRGDAHVTIWGTGTPRREFLHVDDFAAAAVHLMDVYSSGDIVNVGSGVDATILEVAQLVAEVVGFGGRIETDPTKPDGTAQKLLDVHRLTALGWKAQIALREGLADTYRWYLANQTRLRH